MHACTLTHARTHAHTYTHTHTSTHSLKRIHTNKEAKQQNVPDLGKGSLKPLWVKLEGFDWLNAQHLPHLWGLGHIRRCLTCT